VALHRAQLEFAAEESRQVATAVREANRKWNAAMADLGDDVERIELAQSSVSLVSLKTLLLDFDLL